MQGIKRKVVYVTLFETFAILSSTLIMTALGHESSLAGAAAVTASVLAMAWNFVYNSLFEAWEARQATRGRGLWRRVAHALGFEGGLLATLVPLFAWWLDITPWQAFVLNLGMMVFFLVYGFLFNLVFDRLFGLPASALPA